MVVDDMASIPPRKMQSILPQPNNCPTIMPSIIIQKMMAMADIMGEAPILRIFLNEKSKPNENSRNITPMSAHRCILAMSATDAV